MAAETCSGSGQRGLAFLSLWCCPCCRWAIDDDQPRTIPVHEPARRGQR